LWELSNQGGLGHIGAVSAAGLLVVFGVRLLMGWVLNACRWCPVWATVVEPAPCSYGSCVRQTPW
jgi:hypothetical protein